MGLLRSSFEILPTTDIVDTTIYDQDGRYAELKRAIKGWYCLFRYQKPMADTNTISVEISDYG